MMEPRGWTQPSLDVHSSVQNSQLQLENEYEMDPAQFQMLQGGRDSRGASHAGYSGYGQAYNHSQVSYTSPEQPLQDAYAGNYTYTSKSASENLRAMSR